MKKVICVGSVTKDIFLGVEIDDKQSGKICLEAGSKIYTKSYREAIGGGAVNVGAGLTKLGYRSFVFSRTDKTTTGKWIQKQVGKLKLKKKYMQQTGGVPSQTSIIISDHIENDHTILRSGDAVEGFNIDKACQKFKERVDWIYVSSQKSGHLERLEILKNFAEGKHAKIAVNPSSYQIEDNAQGLLEKLKDIEVVFLNLDEAIKIIGDDTVVDKDENNGVSSESIKGILNKLLAQGIKIVVITDGPNGAWAARLVDDKMVVFYLEAIVAKEVADTTGAGDAFASGFLSSFIKDENNLDMEAQERLMRALSGGLVNSASVILEIGATNGLLKPGKLKRKIRKNMKRIIEL